MPLSAFLNVQGRAGVSASDGEDCGVTLRSFAGRLPMSRTRSEPRFHDLRHTHATMLLRQGVHPKVAPDQPKGQHGRRLLRGLHMPRGQAWCYGDAQTGAAVSNVLRSVHDPCSAERS